MGFLGGLLDSLFYRLLDDLLHRVLHLFVIEHFVAGLGDGFSDRVFHRGGERIELLFEDVNGLLGFLRRGLGTLHFLAGIPFVPGRSLFGRNLFLFRSSTPSRPARFFEVLSVSCQLSVKKMPIPASSGILFLKMLLPVMVGATRNSLWNATMVRQRRAFTPRAG